MPAYTFDYSDKIRQKFSRYSKRTRAFLLLLLIIVIVVVPFWAKIQALWNMKKTQKDVVAQPTDAKVVDLTKPKV